MINNRRAQSAMEFLMTYGWAILVVLGALGAMSYFGVLDMANMLPERCSFPTGLECIGRSSIDADTEFVMFVLQNDYGSNILLTGGSTNTDGDCSGATPEFCSGTGCSSDFNSSLTVNNNERATVRLNCTDIAKGRFRTDVTINYNDTLTGFAFEVEGGIRGNAI